MAAEQVIDQMIERSRAAQAILAEYTQEQVDVLVKAIGKVLYDNAEMLSEEAVAESGFGRVDSKILKHKRASMAHWYYMRGKKSVGLIEEDPVNGLLIYAKPIGVLACISPSTNPTSTAGTNSMSAVKCRNTVIVAPHPRAKRCTAHTVRLISEALRKLGAPEHIVQVIEEPTMQLTQELMGKVDVVVATGGPGMIKSAYSSGRPSFGVGAGNGQTLIAPDYEDFTYIAKTLVNDRIYDNGIPCTGEQTIFIPREKAQALLDAFVAEGAFVITDERCLDRLRGLLFLETGTSNPDVVGLPASKLAERIGVSAPDAKVLLVPSQACGRADVLCKEKLCPVITYHLYDRFTEAVEAARTNLLMEGAGHSSVIFSNDDQQIRYVGEQLPVSRVVVNQAGVAASGCGLSNGLPPTQSLGCGSWGNNSISENLTYKHLMNVTRVAYPKKNFTFPSPEELWG